MVIQTGSERIALERQRQVEEEGWTPEHDDEHTASELAMAAKAYIFEAVGRANGICWPEDEPEVPPSWPWDASWWKPSDDPIRNLVKAGALIAAEIDRLQRRAGDQGDATKPGVRAYWTGLGQTPEGGCS